MYEYKFFLMLVDISIKTVFGDVPSFRRVYRTKNEEGQTSYENCNEKDGLCLVK